MKPPVSVFRRFPGRGTALVTGGGIVGLMGGMILAMILFSQAEPIYESTAIVALMRPKGIESELSEYHWLDTEARETVSLSNLTEAAQVAMQDDNRGLTTAEYVNQLQRAVHIRVEHRSRVSLTLPDASHQALNRALAESETVPRAVLVHVSMRGGDPAENARVINAIVEVRVQHYARLSQEMKTRKPEYASHSAASKKLTETEKESETPQPYGERFLEHCEVAHPSTTPVGPVRSSFAWKWGWSGALAGLFAGIGVRVLSCGRASHAQPGP